MFFPKLQAQRRERKTVECFSGLDRRVGSGAGCLREMKNLWSGGYPAMEVRGKRSVLTELTTPHAFLGREALVWVDGAELYINGAKTAPVLTNGDKQLVCMGAYLLVWPDKVYINTKDFSDWGSLENTRSTEGEVTFTLCDAAGTALGSYDVGTNAPSEAETGDLWLDTSRSGCVMRRYDGSAWLEMEGVCTKISATGIGVGFSAGDGVTLSGCGSSELNGLQVLETVEDNWLVVPSLCRTLDSQTAVVTVLRTVPEMDFVTEQGNRLWGVQVRHCGRRGSERDLRLQAGRFSQLEQLCRAEYRQLRRRARLGWAVHRGGGVSGRRGVLQGKLHGARLPRRRRRPSDCDRAVQRREKGRGRHGRRGGRRGVLSGRRRCVRL